jgi:predicted permease
MLPLRSAIKSLRRSPGFATISILSLAVSLGLVASVFALVDGLRHPRTATRDPQNLYEIRMRGEGAAGRISPAEHIDMLQRFVRSVEEVTFSTFARGELISNGVGIGRSGERVGTNYFNVRGVRPLVGRVFTEATVHEDAASSVVISERIWRQVFDAEPRLERLSIRIEDEAGARNGQVIGVMPQELTAETHANFWLALPADLHAFFATERYVFAISRLRQGATIESLNAEFKLATTYLTSVHGKGRIEFMYTAVPMSVDPLRVNEMIWLLVGAAIAVLLIACSNLANLVLSRGLIRQHELAVRLSLGARRRDIIAGVLAECVVVALAGAALGVLASAWGLSLLRGNMPERLPTGALVIAMNWRVIVMSSGAAVISALAFGLLPAFRVSDIQLAKHIKEHSGSTTGRRSGRFPLLVVGQVALSLALLTGVSLLMRASHVVQRQRPDYGFDPARILTVQVGSRSPADTSEAARLALWSATETRLRAHPALEQVAWASGVSLHRGPSLTGERSGGAFRNRYLRSYTYASPNLLRTVGVKIIRGRDFEEHDAYGEGVVVLDSVTALKIWGSEDPIGKLVKFAAEDRISPWFHVIGVSRPVLSDVRRFQGEEIDPQVWMAGRTAFVSPMETGRRPLRSGIPVRAFVVRAKSRDVARVRAEIPVALRDVLGPRGNVSVFGWDDSRRALIEQQRFLAKVFGTFGMLSLALCALGLYSVLSYAVTQRMREVGIRVALGATSRRIFLDVLHDGAILVIAGTAVGGLATIWSNKLVDPYIGLLYHIDAWALVAAEFVLVCVAMLAMMRPALRATRTDPVDVLRAV